MNDNMITDILPFDHELSETCWDRNTAVLAGSTFATVAGTSLFGPVPASTRAWPSVPKAASLSMVGAKNAQTLERTLSRPWDDTTRDMVRLERMIQQSIDRYHKWLIELCQRTVGVDTDISGGRVGRLRRRRDREFERLMRCYGSLGVCRRMSKSTSCPSCVATPE